MVQSMFSISSKSDTISIHPLNHKNSCAHTYNFPSGLALPGIDVGRINSQCCRQIDQMLLLLHENLANLFGHRILSQGEQIREILVRSEEHTSELQSRQYLVCRLLLEKLDGALVFFGLSAGGKRSQISAAS